jgi:serine/threonine protein kinase
MIKVHYLKKTGGSRLRDVRTYKLYCESNRLVGYKSLKSAHELSENEFTHVIMSKLKTLKDPVIVKMHEAGSPFAQRELAIMKLLMNTTIERNIVKYVCDFTCNDDKSRWEFDVTQPQKFCPPVPPPGTITLLHFIVMEYIQDGDLVSFMKSSPSILQLRSLFVQCALVIIELGSIYRVRHGDLNSGNIMIKQTKQSSLTYSLNSTKYKVFTHGIMPVFIDFGRGLEGRHVNKIDVYEDIMQLFFVMSNWVQDANIKRRIREFVGRPFYIKSSSQWPHFIDNIQALFQ